MEELGRQQDEEYGSKLGRLDLEQGWYKEALVIHDKAKVVLAQHKEGNDYGALLTSMGVCHKRLQQWSEAVACYKEIVEHSRDGGHQPSRVCDRAVQPRCAIHRPQAVRGGNPTT
jgi:hypothetical protein